MNEEFGLKQKEFVLSSLTKQEDSLVQVFWARFDPQYGSSEGDDYVHQFTSRVLYLRPMQGM